MLGCINIITSKSIHSYILCIVFCLLAWPSQACETAIYFQHLKQADISIALNKVKVTSCEHYKDLYFKGTAYKDVTMQALAYDTGLCVAQDLARAKELYEISYSSAPAFPNVPLRLALLYECGPKNIRDASKAEFYMKQSAISLAHAKDKGLRDKMVEGLLNGQSMPRSLEKQLAWVDGVLAMPEDERQAIAERLQREGFEETESIWQVSPFAIKPILQENR